MPRIIYLIQGTSGERRSIEIIQLTLFNKNNTDKILHIAVLSVFLFCNFKTRQRYEK